jgi:hypothetical protein
MQSVVYSECRKKPFKSSVVMLSAVMLNVVMLSVVALTNEVWSMTNVVHI